MQKTKQTGTVMIIEDEALLLQAIKKKFESQGISTITCVSGEQALDYLKSVDNLPDAIWLDYYLKSMTGLEFVGKLKETSQWSDIPVIVVSNSASDEKVKNLLALGVKKYLLKANYRLEDLIGIIREFIDSETSQKEE